jgi:RNA polymerase sigma-70 factor (ECF subfamily)
VHEEREVISGFIAGNHGCFEELIMKYRGSATSFARKYVHDPFVAEDIVQESFAEIYVYRQRYKVGYSFKTYLFSIVKHKCIDFIRKKKAIPLDEIPESEGNNLEDIVLAREKNHVIREKMNELKKDYQVVLHLVDFEGFSYGETAKIMGKNLAQVKVLLFRARRKLKSLIESEV